MNIVKAIERIDAIIESGEYEGTPFDRPALELGIEALKQISAWQSIDNHPCHVVLPGETLD